MDDDEMPPVPPPPPTAARAMPPRPAPGFYAGVGGYHPHNNASYVPHLRAVSAAPPVRPPMGAVGASGGLPNRPPAPDRSVAAAAHTIGAAPTVRKLTPAQHDPSLKALVPASVRIQREKQGGPPLKRPRVVGTAQVSGSAPGRPAGPGVTGAAPKKDDASYLEFLDGVRDLGAFE
tara:strand:+ start:3849 stop:4376 length:528 start_codon:yes stop_codon:yes gene_type:complete|mmetsp:Transcript_6758/g.22805  ORF Transcript_6758/g.22805 Transcript_6758/m.22805 type:complete len:176 (-) Transcript_6758:114-641(-)